MDRDMDAVSSEMAKTLSSDRRFRIEHGSFGELGAAVRRAGWEGSVSGVLVDLGVSSPQLDTGERGFSFLRDGPLDMRMDQSRGVTAAEWLKNVSESELSLVLKEYGEERYAKRIARCIVERRRSESVASTRQLAALISAAVPTWEKGKHPATRSFQAIRIRINDELGQLASVLDQAVEVLAVGGRLVVIAFHSLEDRVVKRFVRDRSRVESSCAFPLPGVPSATGPRVRPLGRAIRPSESEVRANPRARSAVLRVAERAQP
jgi:16S rRNA (cytosine1402-N4)-methyltransferase